MVKTRDPQLFRLVGRELPPKRLKHLFELFQRWDARLFSNGQAAIASGFSFKDMFGKLESEFSEASREASLYRRARSADVKLDCALRVSDELGDMVNMAGLMILLKVMMMDMFLLKG